MRSLLECGLREASDTRSLSGSNSLGKRLDTSGPRSARTTAPCEPAWVATVSGSALLVATALFVASHWPHKAAAEIGLITRRPESRASATGIPGHPEASGATT